jgi:MFS family permease
MQARRVLLALAGTNFLSAMGITIVVPLISNIGQIFGVSQAYGIWIITLFMLSYALGMAIMGRLSDAIGRRRVYIASMGVFSLGLLISAIGPNFGWVLVGRFLQGLGASGSLPIAQTIAYEHFGERKGLAMGAISAAFGLGVVAAINLGGGIYQAFDWRAVFYVTFALSLIGWGLSFAIPETVKQRKPLSLDFGGILTFGAAIAAFMMLFRGLSEGPFTDAAAWPYAAVLAAMVGAFLVFERRTSQPAIELDLFKMPAFVSVIGAALTGGIGMFVFQTFLPSFAQITLGYTVAQASYSINLMAATMILAAGATGVLSDRLGPEKALVFSLTTMTLGFLFITVIPQPAWAYYVGSAVAGAGLGSLMTPINVIGMREGGQGREGVTSGIVSLSRTLGGIIGPTFAGFILSQTDFSSLFALDNLIQAYGHIYRFGMWVGVVGLGFALVLLIRSLRKTEVHK